MTAVAVGHQLLGWLTAAGCAALLVFAVIGLMTPAPKGCFSGLVTGVQIIMAVAAMVGLIAVALPLICVGVGLRRRRPWARVMTLVLGGAAGLVSAGLFTVVAASGRVEDDALIWGVVSAIYALSIFRTLLPRRRAAEFRSERSA